MKMKILIFTALMIVTVYVDLLPPDETVTFSGFESYGTLKYVPILHPYISLSEYIEVTH